MKKIKILIVENELLVAKDMKAVLEGLGYEVPAVASTGEDAVQEAGRFKPDLILMDVVLPGRLNGIAAAGRIRSRLDIPVIFITAYSDRKFVEAAKRMHAFGYILKPIKDEELPIAIEMALSRHGAERELKERDEKLNLFLDPATDVFCLLGPDLRILETNGTGLKYFGLERKNLSGQYLFDLLRPLPVGRKVIGPAKFQEVLSNGKPLTLKAIPCLTGQGQRCVNLKVFRTGNRLGLILTDITEKKDIKLALRESEERHRLLVENMNEGIALLDRDGLITYINEKFLKTRGYDRMAVQGHPLTELLDEESARVFQTELRAMSRGASGRPTELVWRTKDSAPVFTIVSPTALSNEKGTFKGAILVITDITERRQVEEELNRSREELRNLYQHLHSVREEESKRIAREIHDELGQALTALKMDLSWLLNRLPEHVEYKTLFREKGQAMSRLIDMTIQTVQKISAELRPGLLDDLGLPSAMEWQAQEFQIRTDIQCQFQFKGSDFKVDPDCATAMFRILQEALTNIVRHAGASRVKIGLREDAEVMELTISDNGRGVTPAEIDSPKSLGIIGMRERLRPFGGELHLSGVPKKGTNVTVRCPKRGVGLT